MANQLNRAVTALAVVFSLIAISAAYSFAESGDDSGEHLFGNWGGTRTALKDSGVTVQSIVTTDLMANVSGGVKRRSTVLGNYDLTGELDTEKAGLWKDGTLFLYVLGDVGEKPSKYIGDFQVTDNIEAYSTARLYEAFYDHRFFDGKFSTLVGLHNYNAEFDSLSYASTLLNSSFGVTKDISQVTPSIFSNTSMAVRFKFLPTDHTYAMTAVYDGVPGDPNRLKGTSVRFKSGDGVFWANEVGMLSSDSEGAHNHYKLGLGYWYHTKKYDDFGGTTRDQNQGLYLIGERALWSESDKNQGLGGFFAASFTQGDRNIASHYFGAGLKYTGLIPSRGEDTIVFGIASARLSGDYRDFVGDLSAAETAFEFNYRAKVLPYLTVQPDIQFVQDPSGRKDIGDAVVMSLRVAVAM